MRGMAVARFGLMQPPSAMPFPPMGHALAQHEDEHLPAGSRATPTVISQDTRAVGFWAAALAAVFSLTYAIAQIAEWLGWLGSQGGAESLSTPLGLVILLTPSLFLGSSFLVLVVSIHQWASGLLLPFIALQMYWHSLIWLAALWAVTFPGSMVSLALLFRRTRPSAAAP